MLRLLHGDGNLMRTEGAFYLQSVNELRTGPALRGTKNDHRPERTLGHIVFSCSLLDCFDLLNTGINCSSHKLVHCHRIAAFYENRLPAITMEQALELVMGDMGQYGRVADLIFIQV